MTESVVYWSSFSHPKIMELKA